ncbi:MAG: NADPH:quinone oxidoreductase family protein [Pirellulales bacterium]|nr:NADPH:quinone oxidoreductase family protein [Pirellulales bacterium]
MKVLEIQRFGGPEVMQLNDAPVPQPGLKQARIRVEAAGLNYSDIMIREGKYLDRMNPPLRLGREFCGVIDALGESPGPWTVGQRVVGTVPGGAMGEFVCAPTPALLPCPEGLSPEHGAAFLIAGLTAMHCIDDCTRVQAGETVLIHAAAGGVGTIAIQIAQARGAKVFGTASSEAKCRQIRELGAEAINYSEGDWVARLRDLTGGRGADVILESVGGDVFRRSFFEALADFGRMVVYGLSSGQMVQLASIDLLASNKTIGGYYLGSYFPRHLDRVALATGKLMQLLGEGKLKLIVGQTFPLTEAVAAFNLMQNRRNIGKVVIKP